MSRLYGLTGLMSLLGFVGLYTDEKYLLIFFIAVLDFRFLFIKPDEMQIEQLKKAGSLAYYSAMAVYPVSMLVALFVFKYEFLNALIMSCSIVLGILLGVQAVAMVYLQCAESHGDRFAKD